MGSMRTDLENICIPRHHVFKHDWRVVRLTELLLMGHSWKSVRNIMAISKPEFDRLLNAAVDKAQSEQQGVLVSYLESEHRAG